ncbi:MAG TPA: hypothetical protein PLW65_05510, partial [Pseudomonadota bacterium]|nr:hypothetical protein [Pseudomonadota bacterium]
MHRQIIGKLGQTKVEQLRRSLSGEHYIAWLELRRALSRRQVGSRVVSGIDCGSVLGAPAARAVSALRWLSSELSHAMWSAILRTLAPIAGAYFPPMDMPLGSARPDSGRLLRWLAVGLAVVVLLVAAGRLLRGDRSRTARDPRPAAGGRRCASPSHR